MIIEQVIFKSISKLKVHDPNDIARTTIKETNIHDNRVIGLKGNKKQKYINKIK